MDQSFARGLLSVTRLVFGTATVWVMCGGCPAAEPASLPHRFIDGLRDRGYADTAVEYLDQLEAVKELPPDLAETLDLERAELLKSAADRAEDSETRERLLTKSREYRDKFIAAHPQHSGVLNASLDELLRDSEKAQLQLARALLDSTAQQKSLLVAAREALVAARTQFARAEREFRGATADSSGVQPAKEGAKEPSQETDDLAGLNDVARMGVAECQLNTAVLTYQIGLSYPDTTNPQRQEALAIAATQLEQLYRRHGGATDIGLRSHVWAGKLAQDLGNLQTALDIFDEVLVMEPEGEDLSAQSFDFFSQVFVFRLRLLVLLDKERDVIYDAAEWMKGHEAWQERNGYLAVKMETAKAILSAKDDAAGSFRDRMKREAIAMLSDVGKTDNPYRAEAIQLRRQYLNSKLPSTGNELLVLAKNAEQAGRFQEAGDLYDKALQSPETTREAESVAEAKSGIDRVRIALASQAYEAKDMEKAYRLAGELVKGSGSELTKSTAAGIALASAYALYSGAAESDRPPRREKLEGVARYILARWPAAADADEARVILAQIQQASGDSLTAMKLLSEVHEESRRYPTAMLMSGKMHLARYLDGRPEKGDPSPEVQAQLEKAIRLLGAAVKSYDQRWDPDAAPSPQWYEAHTYYGQAMIESRSYKEVATSLTTAVDKAASSKEQQRNPTFDLLCALAIKACMAADELAAAGKAAELLASRGADASELNAQLLSYSSDLQQDIRKTLPNLGDAGIAGSITAAPAQAAASPYRTLQETLLRQLSQRQQLSAAGIAYVGSACVELNLTSEARQVYDGFFKRIAVEPAFRSSGQKYVNAARLRFVDLLRIEGNFAQATEEADRLIADNPRALEPLVLKARTVQAWAIKEPVRYDEAVTAWTRVRLLLSRVAKKPPEYYDSIYNAALCLVYQASATKDSAKALQAEQLLNSTLTLTPNLDGPETVQRFQALRERAASERKKHTKKSA